MKNNEKININTHAGHRRRVKDKIKTSGASSFADHELLEVLLFNAIPRGDTNKIAHDLLQTFGNLKNVFSADRFKLMSVSGVGGETAVYLETIGEIFKRTVLCETKLVKINNPVTIKEFLRNSFVFESDEKIIMICADKNLKVIQTITLSKGNSAMASFSVNDAMKSALLAGAKFVIFAHNHFGEAQPSGADVEATKELVQKFALNNIIVLDHIIIGKSNEFSFRDLDMFYGWFEEINISLNEIFKQNNLKEFKMNCSSPDQNLFEFLYSKYLK